MLSRRMCVALLCAVAAIPVTQAIVVGTTHASSRVSERSSESSSSASKPNAFFHPVPTSTPSPIIHSSPLPTGVKYVPSGWPVTLVIPSMGVDAHIEDVNLLLKKNVHAPFKWADVAWHWLGPRPGEPGHAAIFGHLDSYCCPAVFWKLKDLVPGDQIWVIYPHQKAIRFSVRWLKDYPNAQVPTKWMFADRGQRGLVLATCSGDFHSDGTGYDHKLVAYARMILPSGKLG